MSLKTKAPIYISPIQGLHPGALPMDLNGWFSSRRPSGLSRLQVKTPGITTAGYRDLYSTVKCFRGVGVRGDWTPTSLYNFMRAWLEIILYRVWWVKTANFGLCNICAAPKIWQCNEFYHSLHRTKQFNAQYQSARDQKSKEVISFLILYHDTKPKKQEKTVHHK